MKLLLLLFTNSYAFGAACCGGGLSIPSLINGDDKAQLALTYSHTDVVVDSVDSSGVWRKSEEHSRASSYKLEGAHIFSDRWQVGGSLTIVQREFASEQSSGVGDTAGLIGYEYLPDWDYNPYRPKGLGYFQITLPTGRSKAESENGALDSRGNGFLALGVGNLLSKIIGRWDGFANLDMHRSFPKSFSNSQYGGTLYPGWGANWGFGSGYSLKAWRLGGSLVWTYEDPINIQGRLNIQGAAERYATLALSLSFAATDEWSGNLTYSDQTLFGDPVNTSLGRSVAVQVQRRWSR